MTTLPGSIPGLLRRGSPVRGGDDGQSLGTVVDSRDGDLLVFWTWSERALWVKEDAAPADLDLTDPTGRVHALWWLARWWQERHTGGATDWPLRWTAWRYAGARSWVLVWEGGTVTFQDTGCPESVPSYVEVPGLGAVTEDTAALRLAVLHAAGVAP